MAKGTSDAMIGWDGKVAVYDVMMDVRLVQGTEGSTYSSAHWVEDMRVGRGRGIGIWGKDAMDGLVL